MTIVVRGMKKLPVLWFIFLIFRVNIHVDNGLWHDIIKSLFFWDGCWQDSSRRPQIWQLTAKIVVSGLSDQELLASRLVSGLAAGNRSWTQVTLPQRQVPHRSNLECIKWGDEYSVIGETKLLRHDFNILHTLTKNLRVSVKRRAKPSRTTETG